MPSNTTHRIFGNTVFNKLNKKITTNFSSSKNIYYVFCQSFDNLFYYNLLNFKKGKEIREFGRLCHKSKTQEYFINIIRYIKDNNLENNSDCLAYLYGSICHYILDSTIHPFVFYKTGVFNKNKKETYKYNSLHTRMESMLDKYFYELENNNYLNYKHYLDNFPEVAFTNHLKNTINYTFKETYNKNNIAEIYLKSYNQGRFIFKYGVYDKFGIKKQIYNFIDIIRPLKYKKTTYISSYVKKVDSNYLNLEKNEWYSSATDSYSSLSICELYDIAVIKAVKIIEELNLILNNNITIDKLKELIPNISYISGRSITPKYVMHKFEF